MAGNLSQRVFEQLEARIVDRVYPPGTHLVEDVLAAELGVSRTPVREAFRLLQRAGWLDVRPHSGAYVRFPTMEEVRELFELRQCLEERACRLAATRATEGHVRDLRRLLERGWRAVHRRDHKQLTALNSAFHATVADAARNELLRRILDDLAKHVRWHFSAVATMRAEDSWQEHEAMVDAIEAHDPDVAAELAAAHSERTREAYLRRLFEGATVGTAGDGASARRASR